MNTDYERLVGTVVEQLHIEDVKYRKSNGLPKKRNDAESQEYRRFFSELYGSFILKFDETYNTPERLDENENVWPKIKITDLPNIIAYAMILPDAIVREINVRMNGRGTAEDLAKTCHLFACHYYLHRKKDPLAYVEITRVFGKMNIGPAQVTKSGDASSLVFYELMREQNNQVDPTLMFEIVKRVGYDIEKIKTLLVVFCDMKRNDPNYTAKENFLKQILPNFRW
jgi:hypothetical protein